MMKLTILLFVGLLFGVFSQTPVSCNHLCSRVLELTNNHRKTSSSGNPLKMNRLLSQAAEKHTFDMVRQNYFSHVGKDGSTPSQRVTREGYNFRAFGENIAAGQQTPEQVVNAWFNSEGHRRNMLNPAFEEMGCKTKKRIKFKLGGCYTGDLSYRIKWTQTFGSSRKIKSIIGSAWEEE
jgi:uncharacterized protein YkwD